MMPDIKTVMLLYLTINIINTGAVAVIWRQNRGRFAGISFWLVGMALNATGVLLLILRGLIPDLISVIFANTIMLAGILITLIGLYCFTGVKGRQIHNYVLLAVFIAVFYYYSLVQPDLNARVIAATSMILIYTFQCCWLLLRRVAPGLRRITRITGIVFACSAALSFARIILTIIIPQQNTDFFNSGAVSALANTGYVLLNICLTVSLVLMVNQRLLVDDEAQGTALRESEAKYRLLADNTTDGVWLLDMDLKLIYCSPSSEKQSGFTLQEIMEISLEQYFTPDSLKVVSEAFLEEMPKVVANPDYNPILTLDLEYYKKDGTAFWAESKFSIIRDKHGKPVSILGVARDITEHKQKEGALLKSELRYRDLVNNSKNAVAVYEAVADGEDFIFKDFNHAAEMIDKIKKEDILGKSLLQAFPGVKEFGLFEVFQRVWRTGEPERHPITRYYDERISGWRDNYVYRLSSGEIVAIYEDVTTRKQAEEMLQKSEAQYRLLSEHTTDFVWLMDMNLEPIYQSPSAEKLTGFTQQELMELPFEKRVTPESLKLAAEVFLVEIPRIVADPGYNPVIVLELEICRRDGTTLWSENKFTVVRDEHRRPVSILGEARDITERRRTGEALYNSEMLLKATGQMAKVGGWEVDAKTLEVSWTEETYIIHELPLGYKPPLEEAINYFHTEERQKLSDSIQRSLKSGEAWDMEMRFITAKGKHLWTRAICSPQVVDGKTVKLMGTFQDITDRKLAEGALRQEHIMLARTEGIAHIGSWEWDIATDTVTWSDELFRIFQRDPQEGAPSFAEHPAFYHPDDMARLQKAVEAAVTDGTPYELELRAIRKDGETRVCLGRGIAEKTPGGRVVRLVGSVQDITERKLAEVELKKSHKELRSLSSHLISLREEERKLLAREMHDELGQALTALKIDLSWLSKKLPEGQVPLAEKTASMLKLVNNTVRAVKRISTGLRPVLLDDLGLVAAMEWQAGEFQARTGIKTGLDFKPDDIMVDNERATALFRIFQEVLTNVARHAAATRVDAYLHKKDGVLELSVSDNGKGIGRKMINSSKSLGLIGMRERCIYLGGSIDIMGKPGKGTTVTVNLPARGGEP